MKCDQCGQQMAEAAMTYPLRKCDGSAATISVTLCEVCAKRETVIRWSLWLFALLIGGGVLFSIIKTLSNT